jgi:arylsulfatase A-like enzyme
VRDNQFDKALDGLTLGDVMHQAGYHTAVIGKWGLAGPGDNNGPSHPMNKGFDEFFGFIRHADGHVYYHDKEHPLTEAHNDVTAQYENIYSTDLFTARAKKFIVERHSESPNQPFFLYLAYTAVHNALQVPGGPYPAGDGLHGGMQWPLKPTPETKNTWIYPDYAKENWKEQMKRYATMARRLDDAVGDIMQLLRDLKIDDNTVVVFTSDNGPAHEGGADPRYFDSWGPFDGFKRDDWEGGIREPSIVVWPGHIPQHTIDDVPSAFYDWMPTLANVVGIAPPAQTDGVSLLPTLTKQGIQQSRGYLYTEYFFHGGKNGPNSPEAEVMRRKGVTDRGQQQTVRIGDYLGIRVDIKSAADPLRLYDVIKDPHEDHNIASDASHADLLKQMTDLLVTARRPDDSAKRPYDDVPLPAVNVENLKSGHLQRNLFDGSWPWVPDFSAMKPTSTGSSNGIALPQKLPASPFGLSFVGYISIPKDGEYTFKAAADDGVHLWLHDAHLIDSDRASIDHPISASVQLRAGLHPIRVYYRHQSGAVKLALTYSGSGMEEQPIPANALSSQ